MFGRRKRQRDFDRKTVREFIAAAENYHGEPAFGARQPRAMTHAERKRIAEKNYEFRHGRRFDARSGTPTTS